MTPYLPGDSVPPAANLGNPGEGGGPAVGRPFPGAAEPSPAEPDPGESAAETLDPMPRRPHQVLRLEDGDTLSLQAAVVERRVGAHTVRMYAYNGQYPGPLVWVSRGATITVNFTNRIDQPTTIHWHGLRLENRFDGVPGMTQAAVRSGETFVYRVTFPDPGLYWYHPHVREDVQQEMGLYGNLMVRDGRPDYYGPAHREEVLMLDDLLVGEEGPIPLGLERATHGFMGRFGNAFLVNGEPADPTGRADGSWSLDVRRGEVLRFFLTNVANTRTFNLSFRGPPSTGDAPIKVVGSDVGTYEREERVGSVVIAPAERYIVHTRFDRPGTYALVNRVRGIDHLSGSFIPEEDTLGLIRVSPEAAPSGPTAAFDRLRPHPWTSAEIDRVRGEFHGPPDLELELALETGPLPFVVERVMRLDSAYFHPVEWSGTMPMMNWASTEREARWTLVEPATGRENMDIRWTFERGDVAKIRIANRRHVLHGMQHPIHFHGQRFLVLAVNGVPNDNLVWKDTVLVPAGATVDILLETSNPGRWMAHCHIAEHLESGMMLGFTVR